MNISICHPDRKYHALGLCYICYQNKWKAEHPERVKESKNKYYRNHREDERKRQRENWKQYKDSPNNKARRKRSYWNNRKKRLEQSKEIYIKLHLEIVSVYGGHCKCCGETRPELLTIDHINGGGTKHRKETGGHIKRWLKKNGFPRDGFRLLCYNCNCSRGTWGYCPHEEERHDSKV